MIKKSLKTEILEHLIEKWGEHIETVTNPSHMVVDILLNTIISQMDEINYLKKIKQYK